MVSIICPVYEMAGRGVEFLSELLESIVIQRHKDYEVIITDNSKDNEIKNYIESNWENDDFIYVRNDGNSFAKNMNYGIQFAKGEVIKPMAQDDKFLHRGTIGRFAEAFTRPIGWAACTSVMVGLEDWKHFPHNHSSYKNLLEGENTYGCPSCMAYLKSDIYFDENLIWLMDCDFYARLVKKYGWPAYIDDEIFIRQWDGQITRTSAVGQIRLDEQQYCREKHLINGH